MDKYTCLQVSKDKFAIYHTIYTDSNISVSFDWNDRINRIQSNVNGYFILLKDKLIGGFTLLDNQVSHPFMVSPFNNRCLFWKVILDYALETCCENQLQLADISEVDAHILTKQFSAAIQTTQRRMLRPTEESKVVLNEKFYFVEPSEEDIPHIIQTVFEAHSSGYTSKFKAPDKVEIEKAINFRFQAFLQTKSLHLGTIVKNMDNDDAVGVCIAGIYPDSSNSFSTIYQVSVLPSYRRKGIAEAMMLRTINIANTISPVITLGVMVGNPAEQLYNKLGFSSGPSYYGLVYIGGA